MNDEERQVGLLNNKEISKICLKEVIKQGNIGFTETWMFCCEK